MLQLQSGRLQLLPLNLAQLLLLAESRYLLENTLHLQHLNIQLSAGKTFLQEFNEVLQNHIIPMVRKHPVEYAWYTHWLIIESASMTCIGGIGGSGVPDENGQVMIGYFIDRRSEGNGYASEALGCLVKWMFSNPSLKTLVADTPMEHVASQKVLGNNGFVLLGEVRDGFRWQLDRPVS